MIKFRHKGDFSKTSMFLTRAKKLNFKALERVGEEGVAALASATPVDTGLTANSWYYKIYNYNGGVTIAFNNSNRQNGVLVAIVLYYDHATRNGGWVEGQDYITPAIKPIFDRLVKEAWEEVTSL